MSIKLLVQKDFPGINVTLSHHPPARSKYIASKLISTAQVLIIMIVMAGKHICVEMRMRIPSWYLRLTAHKFVVIAIPWLLGSIAINYLQNTEGFEIFFNGGLVLNFYPWLHVHSEKLFYFPKESNFISFCFLLFRCSVNNRQEGFPERSR